MEIASGVSSPVSTTLEPTPPRESAQLSIQQNRGTADTSTQQSNAAQPAEASQASTPDPTARVGSQIDTFV